MKKTNEIVCTGIELSPDGWKHVYLNFTEKVSPEEEKSHRIVLPFEREEKVEDEEKGIVITKKVKCMRAGNFSRSFRDYAVAEAMDAFAPDCLKDVLRLTRLATELGSTTSLSGIQTLEGLLRRTKVLVDAYDTLKANTRKKAVYKKEARAWRLYSSILYQFEHWA